MVVLETWRYTSEKGGVATILPDGCRDLIYHHENGQRPKWFISSLDDKARLVSTQSQTHMVGYRMKPGSIINESAILNRIKAFEPDSIDVISFIEEHAKCDVFIDEAIHILGNDRASIATVSHKLGVSSRSLQRKLLKATGRSPIYWAQLARVRNAAKILYQTKNYADTAFNCRYSDQAHMTREFNRWFGVTPKQFLSSKEMTTTVHQKAYA